MVKSKRCTHCAVVRPASEFTRSTSKTDGLSSWCKVCQAQYRRENRARIRARQHEYRESEHGREMRARAGRTGTDRAEYQRQYREQNAERLSVYNREYRNDPEVAARLVKLNRSRALMKRYRLTVEQYDEMLAAQDGRCAICRKEPPAERRLAVDHDRKCCPGRESCGECIRALLCTFCNNWLSALENTDWIENAMAYLGSHGSRNKR